MPAGRCGARVDELGDPLAASSGASPVRITTIRSSGSFATAGSAHCTAWPVPRCSVWMRDVDRAGAEARVERGLHGFDLVAEDRDDARGAGGARRGDDPVQHRAAGDAWRTFAMSLFIRVPSPAAMMKTRGA